jgi:drug/metabolite transporter superfamily protein YnfA
MSTQASTQATGPLGQPRGVFFVIAISIITIGIYTIYWAYKTQDEMKQHTGEGLGGVLGLVIWVLLNPVSAFVIPSEVGKMYAKRGGLQPLSGWTGLWLFPFGIFIIPAIVWFVKVQGALNRYWESAGMAGAPANEPGVA